MKLAIVICLARVAILVGGVCDLLNLENYSARNHSVMAILEKLVPRIRVLYEKT